MAFRIKKKESVQPAIRRIAKEQIDKMLGEIADDALDVHQQVHQVRKRCKKIRGLLRLVRPSIGKTYKRENAWYRDAARILSQVRDAKTARETLDHIGKEVLNHSDKEESVSQKVSIADQGDNAICVKELLQAFMSRIQEGRSRIEDWKVQEEGFSALGGLAKTYRRCRKTMRQAYDNPTPENFHEWRKRVKYHRYHVKLLCSIWKPLLSVQRSEGKILSDLLGDEHDLEVLRKCLETTELQPGKPLKTETLNLFIRRRRSELRYRARPLGLRLFAENPGALKRRFRKYWGVWRCPLDQST